MVIAEPLPTKAVADVNNGWYELKLIKVPLLYIDVAFRDPATFNLYVAVIDVPILTFPLWLLYKCH